jgi:hypothetical protein
MPGRAARQHLSRTRRREPHYVVAAVIREHGRVVSLQDEIDARAKEIHTDGYPMSIGELVSLYEDGELDIHPEFQRFYRWTDRQKSRLIESILLGIPIPMVFVSQREDGVWDVIDGLQRLSTIFQFVGILKDIDGQLVAPLVLEETDYLPSLDGKHWEGPDESSFSRAQRIDFKRAKLEVKIIKKTSDPDTKYELFQRLNTGGTPLSDQEIRNCVLIMIDETFYRWLLELSESDDFKATILLTDRKAEEQYDLELVLRFIALMSSTEDDLGTLDDIGDYLDKSSRSMAADKAFDRNGWQDLFRRTFSILGSTLEDNSFRRFSEERNRFLGGFSISAFEAVSVGVGSNIDSWERLAAPQRQQLLAEKTKALWGDEIFLRYSGSGVRASQRTPVLVPYAKDFFRP